MWTQNDIKINHKKWNISEVFFCIEPKLKVQLFHLSQNSMLCPLRHFHGNTMGSTPSPFKGKNQSFSLSRSVICSCCSFRGCHSIWTLQLRHKQKIVCYTLDQQLRHFGKVEDWYEVCCYGDIITNITICTVVLVAHQRCKISTCGLAQIFRILLFYLHHFVSTL